MHTYIAESDRLYPIFGNTLSVTRSKWGIITLQCNILTMLIVSFVALHGWNIADTANNTRQSFVRFVISKWLWVNQIYPWKINPVIWESRFNSYECKSFRNYLGWSHWFYYYNLMNAHALGLSISLSDVCRRKLRCSVIGLVLCHPKKFNHWNRI